MFWFFTFVCFSSGQIKSHAFVDVWSTLIFNGWMRTTLVFGKSDIGKSLTTYSFKGPKWIFFTRWFYVCCNSDIWAGWCPHSDQKTSTQKTGPQKLRNPWSLTGTLNILTNRIIVVGLAGSKYKSYLSHEKKFGVVEFHPVASDHFW